MAGKAKLVGIMGVYVDDVLLGGRGALFEKPIATLKATFPIANGQGAKELSADHNFVRTRRPSRLK